MSFEKVYLIGNGRIADDCLRILVKEHIPVEFIEIFAEKFSFTGKLCERLGVVFHHIDKNEVKAFLAGLKEKTLIISAHNSYIFPKEVCEKENLTIINLHIAYLPMYRGMNPSTWAIFNQEKYAGVTWHTVSSKIDNGRIIIQSKVDIDPDDTAIKLMLKCFKQGVTLFEENLESFLSETFDSYVPAEPDTHLYLAKDLPNGGFLDESWDYEKTYAFLRSMDYTGTNIMQLPRIKLEGKVYEITKYAKNNNPVDIDQIKVVFAGDELKLNWGTKGLICILREVADTVS